MKSIGLVSSIMAQWMGVISRLILLSCPGMFLLLFLPSNPDEGQMTLLFQREILMLCIVSILFLIFAFTQWGKSFFWRLVVFSVLIFWAYITGQMAVYTAYRANGFSMDPTPIGLFILCLLIPGFFYTGMTIALLQPKGISYSNWKTLLLIALIPLFIWGNFPAERLSRPLIINDVFFGVWTPVYPKYKEQIYESDEIEYTSSKERNFWVDQSIKHLPNREDVNLLIEVLNNSTDDRVRSKIAKSFGHMFESQYHVSLDMDEDLIKLQHPEYADVVDCLKKVPIPDAIYALSLLKSKGSIEALSQLLEQDTGGKEDNIIEALIRIDPQRAIRPFTDAFERMKGHRWIPQQCLVLQALCTRILGQDAQDACDQKVTEMVEEYKDKWVDEGTDQFVKRTLCNIHTPKAQDACYQVMSFNKMLWYKGYKVKSIQKMPIKNKINSQGLVIIPLNPV